MSPLPTKCEMPDLGDLQGTIQSRSLVHALIGDRGVTEKESLHRKNLTRLIEKAIFEYQCARLAILNQLEEMKRSPAEMTKGRVIYMFKFTDHFETSINAFARLVRVVNRICQSPETLNVPDTIPGSSAQHEELIRRTRNTVEHMDERVQNDQIKKGRPIILALDPSEEGAIIGAYFISFSEYAEALRAYHQIAISVFDSAIDDKRGRSDERP